MGAWVEGRILLLLFLRVDDDEDDDVSSILTEVRDILLLQD